MPHVDIHAATQEHFARIHRAALALCGNPWDADDLAQETFLTLTRNPRQFAGRSQLYTWLYGILLNLERRLRRSQGTARRKLQVVWDAEIAAPAVAPAAEAPLEAREWKTSLWASVAELPDAQRQALVLRFSEGLPYDEIAAVLACPLGTVKSRIFNGLLAVRRMLRQTDQEQMEPPEYPHSDHSHAV